MAKGHAMPKNGPPVGGIILGLGAIGLGLAGLLSADFAGNWQPVPNWFPARAALAYLSGASLLVAGGALVTQRHPRGAAVFLCAFLCSWVLFLQMPHVFAGKEAAWLAPAETLAVSAGAWTFFWLGAPESTSRTSAVHAACAFFGVMLLVFGLAHFLYIGFTAAMIPAWIPWRVPWAWITGAGHIAAGLSIITGIQARLGATMLALMMSCFVVFVHIPRIIASVDNVAEWRLGSTALLLTGAAWITASALASRQGPGESALDWTAPLTLMKKLHLRWARFPARSAS